jgi:deoxyribodipyrimidine photo-lyase
MSETSIVWLRDDLRLADNPALSAAAKRGGKLALVYVLDQESAGIRPLGAASRWWLHQSLESLDREARAIGLPLVLRCGSAEVVLPQIVQESGATAVFWNRRYGPVRDVDAHIKATLTGDGIDTHTFAANLLFEPWAVLTANGSPYRVFTAFWRACGQRSVRVPLVAPTTVNGIQLDSMKVGDLRLLPQGTDWSGGLRDTWTPGERGAHDRLEVFATDILAAYSRRDEPAQDSTSMLSPHLRFGEVSPYQVWDRIQGPLSPEARLMAPKFLSEVGWREFNWHTLYHFPNLTFDNYRREFDVFPWDESSASELKAWQRGSTGIPLVDAGMRQLWHTGYMHNRVRMVTASFLVKNLLIDWREGERWFWDTLVDADEASNPANWQWVAGSGADTAPYFRVFNPVLQADKFDRDRAYIDQWIPENEPPTAPIVDLKESRMRALAAYEAVKREAARLKFS